METGLRIESILSVGEAAEGGVSETAIHPVDGRAVRKRAGYGSLP
ncbi:MAG: hypothetical protein STSR0004_22780 [Peptococcaceae bacterium]